MIKEIWFLVVMYYSPGGDYMSSRVWEFDTHTQCVKEMVRVNKTVYPLRQRADAVCMRKDKVAGIR